jgi:hypothetical protein
MLVELQSFQGNLHADRLSPTENLAFNLIGFFLNRNALGFRNLVVVEMSRRMPGNNVDLIEAAYDKAFEYWSDAYCE